MTTKVNLPSLEKPEQKQNQDQKQEFESKSQALNEDTPASNTGHTQSTITGTATTSGMSQKQKQKQGVNQSLSQKHETDTGGESDQEKPPQPRSSEVADDKVDQIVFQHRVARAWRWDEDQRKYRGRGKGQMTIYQNKITGLAWLKFFDEKNEKTRLLQYIDGIDQAHLLQSETNSNNHQFKQKKMRLFGSLLIIQWMLMLQ